MLILTLLHHFYIQREIVTIHDIVLTLIKLIDSTFIVLNISIEDLQNLMLHYNYFIIVLCFYSVFNVHYLNTSCVTTGFPIKQYVLILYKLI